MGIRAAPCAAQPAPGNRLDLPDQDTCADLSFGLVPPPIVDLRFGERSAPEPWLMLGRSQGPLFVRHRNAGGLASANPVRILAQLPPGFSPGAAELRDKVGTDRLGGSTTGHGARLPEPGGTLAKHYTRTHRNQGELE